MTRFRVKLKGKHCNVTESPMWRPGDTEELHYFWKCPACKRTCGRALEPPQWHLCVELRDTR